jgi:hypothetical protein
MVHRGHQTPWMRPCGRAAAGSGPARTRSIDRRSYAVSDSRTWIVLRHQVDVVSRRPPAGGGRPGRRSPYLVRGRATGTWAT